MTQGPEILTPGTKFQKYQVVRKLGAGGMGAVYEALHPELKKRVAIKVLRPEMAAEEEVRRRFLREGEAASRIQHPNVVQIYDFGVQDGIAFLVMEFLEGSDLEKRLARGGPLAAAELANVMLPVCSAVAAAHEAGVIHRDLKPANVFLASNPRGEPTPKVLDFGISKIVDDGGAHLTRGTAVMGTLHYLSPEQVLARPNLDARVDQYALGIMMYQCLSGRLPFDDSSLHALTNAIVRGECPPLPGLVSGLDPGLAAVVARAMAADRGERFGSIRELGQALLPFAGPKQQVIWADHFGEAAPSPAGRTTPPPEAPRPLAEPLSEVPLHPPVPTSPGTAPAPLAPRPRSLGWVAAALGGVAALSLGLLLYLLTNDGSPAPERPAGARAWPDAEPQGAPDAQVLLPPPAPDAAAADVQMDSGLEDSGATRDAGRAAVRRDAAVAAGRDAAPRDAGECTIIGPNGSLIIKPCEP